MNEIMNKNTQRLTDIVGKATMITLLIGMAAVIAVGLIYRHSGVGHVFFGKADASSSLFYEPTPVSVIPESVIAEREANGACGCPYCCSVS